MPSSSSSAAPDPVQQQIIEQENWLQELRRKLQERKLAALREQEQQMLDLLARPILQGPGEASSAAQASEGSTGSKATGWLLPEPASEAKEEKKRSRSKTPSPDRGRPREKGMKKNKRPSSRGVDPAHIPPAAVSTLTSQRPQDWRLYRDYASEGKPVPDWVAEQRAQSSLEVPLWVQQFRAKHGRDPVPADDLMEPVPTGPPPRLFPREPPGPPPEHMRRPPVMTPPPKTPPKDQPRGPPPRADRETWWNSPPNTYGAWTWTSDSWERNPTWWTTYGGEWHAPEPQRPWKPPPGELKASGTMEKPTR